MRPQKLRKPAYDIEKAKELVKLGDFNIAYKAFYAARTQLKLSKNGIKREFLKLEKTHFDHSVWADIDPKRRMDIYKYPYKGKDLYIKFWLTNENICVIFSFKEFHDV